jgi:hypothetical protein
MTKNNKPKQFDCIKMKNNIQQQIYNETKNMSVEEILHYFNGSGKNLIGNEKQSVSHQK